MSLYWDTPYAVALALRREHRGTDLQDVTLREIFEWTLALPDFLDEASLCNDEMLYSIFQEWYEVSINE